ncbi:hypothetical protein LCGC14_2548260, partial [marine sediment metagenome]
VAGWNWIAYPPQASEQTEMAVSSIMTKATQVKSQTQSVVKIGQDLVGDLEQISPGKGYIIRMDEPGTLIYPEGWTLAAQGVGNETIPTEGMPSSWAPLRTATADSRGNYLHSPNSRWGQVLFFASQLLTYSNKARIEGIERKLLELA